MAQRSREWRKANPEKVRTSWAKYYAKHRDRICAWNRNWNKTHRLKIRKTRRAYYARTLEHRRKVHREWRLKNINHRRRYLHWYHATNAVRKSKLHRKWRIRNKASRNLYLVNWRSKNKKSVRIWNASAAVRRGGIRSKDKRVSKIIFGWLSEPFFKCRYCLNVFPTEKMQIDHIHPVSKGGTHSAKNICRSCPRCNQSKGNRKQPTYVLKHMKDETKKQLDPQCWILKEEAAA